MKWKKRGLVYVPTGEQSWARTHCLLPTPLFLAKDLLRVYFAALDDHNYGRIGYVDLDPENPCKVREVGLEPVLDIGEAGTFDDCGVVPSCAVTIHQKLYLYYVGFQRAERVPYMLFTGLAVDTDGGKQFRRYARTPVFDRTALEPFSRGAPHILEEGEWLRAWYWSCTHWSSGSKGLHYNNVIRHARSTDGLNWSADSTACLVPIGEDEFALGRPCVLHDPGIYRMWYSIRSHSRGYRIGYAESENGLTWERRDQDAGIDVSEHGWDSEMVCYPMILDFGGARHMFFNGNRHGATGFGWATLEE